MDFAKCFLQLIFLMSRDDLSTQWKVLMYFRGHFLQTQRYLHHVIIFPLWEEVQLSAWCGLVLWKSIIRAAVLGRQHGLWI